MRLEALELGDRCAPGHGHLLGPCVLGVRQVAPHLSHHLSGGGEGGVPDPVGLVGSARQHLAGRRERSHLAERLASVEKPPGARRDVGGECGGAAEEAGRGRHVAAGAGATPGGGQVAGGALAQLDGVGVEWAQLPQ